MFFKKGILKSSGVVVIRERSDMMANPYEGYVKKKDFLVCIDSDGCAIDSMDIKHIRCFGPCMIEEWGLEEHKEDILKRWNEINLYSMTRGINRFKGLAAILKEINEKITPVEDLDSLLTWLENADELSNAAVEKAAKEKNSSCLEKALNWSKAVNQSVSELPKKDVRPFDGVLEKISALHESCDVAIVSSANYEAVKEEWTRFGLIEHVDIVLAQNAGSKKSCIAKLLTCGYDTDKVMVTGDAPGDMDAAKQNGVFYYPILVKHEVESWANIMDAVERLKAGTFAGEYQDGLIRKFIDNLS